MIGNYHIEIKDKVYTSCNGTGRDTTHSYSIEIRSEEPGKYQVVFKNGFHNFLNSCPGIGELANMLPNCTKQLSEFLVIEEPDIGLILAKNTLFNDALLLILEELAKYSGEPAETLFDLIQSQLLRDLNIILLRDSQGLSMPVGEHLIFESTNRESKLQVKQEASLKTVEMIDIKRFVGEVEDSNYDELKRECWQAYLSEKRYSNTGLNYTKYCLDEGDNLTRFELVYQSFSSKQDKRLSRLIERIK
ncbi:hypothetical protein J8M20_08775 [Pseudoalteromonas luteoviolacea]|uniref:hypothetical protein n=1 Tax=Pseudoalteromonas luteoviolacea TaxID=43657 RepID=UPI001B365AFD|nr:hypothetical protein [Pseudoalteromonas luteoviolacea]MBQ4811429.1 hypothetical protein [Pseudoalteromonas luteoviolacea]